MQPSGFHPYTFASKAVFRIFRRLMLMSCPAYLPLQLNPYRVPFGAFETPLPVRASPAVSPLSAECPNRVDRLRSSTIPAADFCTAVREPHDSLSPVFETQYRSPEVSPTAFIAHLSDLQIGNLDGYGLRDHTLARPVPLASYLISVRQVATLLHASFRPHLTVTPLRFASTSPPSGCAGDFHPRAAERARRTSDTSGKAGGLEKHGAVQSGWTGYKAFGTIRGWPFPTIEIRSR